MTLAEFVAHKIRDLRLKSGLSQEALANGIRVATNTISRWETGTYKPAIEDLDKLARFFNVSVLEFFPAASTGVGQRREVSALLRAAQNLPPKDVEELRRYAEFRVAQNLMRQESGRSRRAGKDHEKP